MSRRPRKTYRVLVLESSTWEVTLNARNEEAALEAAEERVNAQDQRNHHVGGNIEALSAEEVQR